MLIAILNFYSFGVARENFLSLSFSPLYPLSHTTLFHCVSHLSSCSFSSISFFSASLSLLLSLKSGPTNFSLLCLLFYLESHLPSLFPSSGFPLTAEWTWMSVPIWPRRRVHSSLALSPLFSIYLSLSLLLLDLLCLVPSFSTPLPRLSSSELSLSRSARIQLSRLRCNGHSSRSRIGLSSSSICDHCGNSLSDLSHLVLSCPFFVRRPLSFSFFSLFQPEGCLQDAGVRFYIYHHTYC